MAKTAQDYIELGNAIAHEEQPRPEGNSWQAKAQQQGYDAYVKELAEKDAYWADVSAMKRADELAVVPVGGYPVGTMAVQTAPTPGIGRGFVEVRECYPVAFNPDPHHRAIYGVVQRKLSTVNAVQSHINSLLLRAQTAETMKGAKLQSKAFSLALKWRAKGITLAY